MLYWPYVKLSEVSFRMKLQLLFSILIKKKKSQMEVWVLWKYFPKQSPLTTCAMKLLMFILQHAVNTNLPALNPPCVTAGINFPGRVVELKRS